MKSEKRIPGKKKKEREQRERKIIRDINTYVQGASRVMFYYNHSVKSALLDIFPDIGFEKLKFNKGILEFEFKFKFKFNTSKSY